MANGPQAGRRQAEAQIRFRHGWTLGLLQVPFWTVSSNIANSNISSRKYQIPAVTDVKCLLPALLSKLGQPAKSI